MSTARHRRHRSEGQPRKRPSGARGQAIVDAIVEAAERAIREHGYESLTSNRIAEAAGVSIGSFYQYFPNTDAVVAEIARRIERRTLELARERLAEAGGPDVVEAAADALIDVVIGETLGDTRVRQAAQQQIRPAWVRDDSEAVHATVHEMVRDFLAAHRSELAADVDPETAAFILVTSVEAVAEAAVAGAWLDARRDALRQALRTLVLRYLGRPADG